MKIKKRNAELIWKQFEDLLVPRLRLSVIDRAVYSRLLRHSRMEGKLRLRFSIAWLVVLASQTTPRAMLYATSSTTRSALGRSHQSRSHGRGALARRGSGSAPRRPGPSAPRCQPRGD